MKKLIKKVQFQNGGNLVKTPDSMGVIHDDNWWKNATGKTEITSSPIDILVGGVNPFNITKTGTTIGLNLLRTILNPEVTNTSVAVAEGKMNDIMQSNKNQDFYQLLKKVFTTPKKKSGGKILKFQSGGSYKKDDPGQDWHIYYWGSPMALERTTKLGRYTNPVQVVQDRLDAVKRQRTQYWNIPESPEQTSREEVSGFKTSGSNAMTPGRVIISYPQADKLGVSPDEISAHEYGHKAGSTNFTLPGDTPARSLLSTEDLKDLETRNIYMKKILGNGVWTPNFSTDNPNASHDTSGYESKADIDSFRFMMYRDKIYDAGTQVFTKNHLGQAKDKYKDNYIFNRLKGQYSDDDLIYLMNNIAENKPQNIPGGPDQQLQPQQKQLARKGMKLIKKIKPTKK